MSVRRPATSLWALAALGLAGSVLTALVAPRALEDHVVGWWYPELATSRASATKLVWLGMALLAVAWLAIVREVRRAHGAGLTVRRASVVTALWVLPLALAPPLFSRDIYSYLAQGTLLHLGHDPYTQTPAVLSGLGDDHLLAAVSPFWRHTTAPYGPLFLALVGLIAGICGDHLIVAVMLSRALDLVGLLLLLVHVPRLARALGSDPAQATWLAAASPLTLLTLVAPGHNDLLMAGLLAAGVAYALRGNPLLGIAVCALAATLKLPALVGAVFVTVGWARTERGGDRGRLLAAAAATTLAVLGAVTLISGAGLGWISSGVFSTPARVHLAITPATALGETAGALLHTVGVGVSSRGLEGTAGVVATVLVAGIGLRLLISARVPNLVGRLGATLLLAAVGGPAAWPWYLAWGLVLLSACPGPQRSPVLLAVLALAPFLVKPDGILVLPITAAPAVLAVYLGTAVTVWTHARGRRARPAPALVRT